ncbi:hypothetical protein FP2506_12979 [Fulvimarina pelagi HTCC2506]|uniref:DUF2259 domain-containing protein n=2 Tax=Fulvimarina pelagi TaxID=217511 RepID=Q0G1A0_9HYPH|nr:DUF2259 domain-containing protein [Fulvimarina pelagi]EAU41181.1 hypothetical protein FP2506_12979 [Fulvimarina pelagi HTCC2506]BAT30808.1 hypothetical protein [Fulvimarina pelagi]
MASVLFLTAYPMIVPAHAGDLAKLEPIGFSDDGAVFAYQESGIQDGSGFPYANIFVLDLDKDRFIRPSPIRVTLSDETSTVADAMNEARSQASILLSDLMPEPRPGLAVIENLPTDLSTDGKVVRFVPRLFVPPIDAATELRLSTFPMAGPELCEGITDTAGFKLNRIALAEGEKALTLHEDTGIPFSRGCPTDYEIRQVRLYMKASGGYSGVAIIAVESYGFEGPDTRHIAVPVPMD